MLSCTSDIFLADLVTSNLFSEGKESSFQIGRSDVASNADKVMLDLEVPSVPKLYDSVWT